MKSTSNLEPTVSLVERISSSLSTRSNRGSRLLKSFDVQHGIPIRELTNKDTIVPICIASMLFCMWGLAYGLLDIMNYHIKVAMGIKREQAAILAATYYAAYIPIPCLVAGPIIRKFGYRAAMVFGLLVLAVGDFFMSLGAQAYSFPGMAASHFVVGVGVSTLERAANPYAVNCGPRTRATLRILFAQAWAGIGTVIAPFLANVFVFNSSSSGLRPAPDPLHPGRCLIFVSSQNITGETKGDLSSVITFYRGLGAIIIGMALVLGLVLFRTNWVPEVPQPKSPKVLCGWRLWKHPLCSMRYARLWWGVAANFVNLGCQVTFAQFFIEHMKVDACASDHWAALCLSFAQIAFVAGRFAAAGLVTMPTVFKPRYVLAAFIAGAIGFCAAGTEVTSGAAIACAVMVLFFEAPSFPMIFESATADFEEWTSSAETIMIMSISGGALQPALMGRLVSSVRISTAWWLTTGAFCLVFSYALANNIIPSFRNSLDATQLGEQQDSLSRDAEKHTASSISTGAESELTPRPTPVESKGYFGGRRTSA